MLGDGGGGEREGEEYLIITRFVFFFFLLFIILFLFSCIFFPGHVSDRIRIMTRKSRSLSHFGKFPGLRETTRE